MFLASLGSLNQVLWLTIRNDITPRSICKWRGGLLTHSSDGGAPLSSGRGREGKHLLSSGSITPEGNVLPKRSVALLPLRNAKHCQGPMIRGQLPWENARCASGWCNVMPASAAAGSPRIRTPPSPRPEWARAPESAAPLTPSCLGEERMPSGDLHAEAGPNPNLNPRSWGNKEEKGKSLPAASGAAH